MAIKKELLINALQAVEIDDRENIPTAVLFSKDGIFIGNQAIERARDATDLNENFKLNLGEAAPNRLEPPRFETGDGQARSAHEITKAYIENVLKGVNGWVSGRGLRQAKRILVAEPLALDRNDNGSEKSLDWLANYRFKVKSILSPSFDEIDFLPEPFAVFQYYRYGVRHPLLATRAKHIALVVDFGGGTFDVSIVETTTTGDVSGGGRNSKPLAASSVAVGGGYINYVIAKELVRRNLDKSVDKNKLERAWKTYREGAELVGGYSSLADDLRQFIRNMRKVISQVEQAKIHIVEGIADWSLNAEFSPCPACNISIPKNPFALNPELIEVRFDANEFRSTFVNNIWSSRLKSTLKNAIERALVELEDRPITIVLLSGGSANIRWLATLMESELQEGLAHAEIIEMHASFQEVVSKGLAIECARRTYNSGDSDFKAVTYNRLCMVVGADGEKPLPVKYKQIGVIADRQVSDGTLLHSAYSMGGLIDKPLRWKFKLQSPPKRFLDYYFLKSSLDYEDYSSLQNVEHRVYTPAKTDFSSALWVELSVREDGTATPRFVYKQGRDEADSTIVEGRPFFLDMTTGGAATQGEVYIGLDFGTSNSAVSYVEQNAIRVYTQRTGEAGWREINELIEMLPYPVSNPLVKFLGSTAERDRLDRFAETFESLLFFIFIVGYQDHLSSKGEKKTNIFKNWRQASAGPLWGMLRQLLEQKSRNSHLFPGFKKLADSKNEEWINKAIASINDHKHHRSVNFVDHYRVLGLLANILNSALSQWRFGYFEDVKKKGFSGKRSGLFRAAHGKHAPFVDMFTYEGQHDFSDLEAVLANHATGCVLRLSPFIYWTQRNSRGENSAALLDTFDGKTTGYRTVEGGQRVLVTHDSDLSELQERCLTLAEFDLSDSSILCTDIELSKRTL